jgi:predicted RNA-binding protein with PUA-like domain
MKNLGGQSSMPYWLLKTEPTTYSYADLEKDEKTRWEGVTNSLALKNLRSMRAGDHVLIYHTGREKSIVGAARVASDPYLDPRSDDPSLLVVDIVPEARFSKPVPLAAIKRSRDLSGFVLLRLPRLSVVPVTLDQWRTLIAMSR